MNKSKNESYEKDNMESMLITLKWEKLSLTYKVQNP